MAQTIAEKLAEKYDVTPSTTIAGTLKKITNDETGDVNIASLISKMEAGGDETFANFLMVPDETILPKGITNITSDFNAIMKAAGIVDIEIPGDFCNGIVNGFTTCNQLTRVKIGDGINKIGDEAFMSCTNLTNVILPQSLTIVSGYAFQSCTTLSTIDFPGHINKVMNRAFYGCSSLSRVIFRYVEPPTTVGSNAFTGCSDSLTFYVPDEAVDAYKAVSGLSSFVNKILPISALEA